MHNLKPIKLEHEGILTMCLQILSLTYLACLNYTLKIYQIEYHDTILYIFLEW